MFLHEIDKTCRRLEGASDEELVGEIRVVQALGQLQLAVRLVCLLEHEPLRDSYLKERFGRAAARAWLQEYLTSWEENGHTASQVFAQGWDGREIEECLGAEGLAALYEPVEEAWEALDTAQVEAWTLERAPQCVTMTLGELERVWSSNYDEWGWVQGQLQGDELATFTLTAEHEVQLTYTLSFGALTQERLFTLSELLQLVHYTGC